MVHCHKALRESFKYIYIYEKACVSCINLLFTVYSRRKCLAYARVRECTVMSDIHCIMSMII